MLTLRNLVPWRNRGLNRTPGYTLDKTVDSMFDDFFNDFERFAMQPFGQTGFNPTLDVSESDHAITVTAELPGLTENDVEISLTHDVLTIKGEKKHEHEDKGDNYHRIERSYGSFQRRVALPAEVESDKVEARFKNGVLTIALPKSAKAQAETKKITVKTS